MDFEATPRHTLDEMQAALDRAAADVAAGRVVLAREVHARLRRAVTQAKEQQGTPSPR